MSDDDRLRELGKQLPFDRPSADRREALRSSILVAASQADTATATRKRWLLVGGGFAAGAVAAAAIAAVVIGRADPAPVREAHARIDAPATAKLEHTVTATATGTDEVVRVRAGVARIAVPTVKPGDRVRLQTADAEVEGTGVYEVAVVDDRLARVTVTDGSARVNVRIGGEQQQVFLAAGQTWRPQVVTAAIATDDIELSAPAAGDGDGTQANGTSANGAPGDGRGATAHGTSANGAPGDGRGATAHGTSANGAPLDGATANGAAAHGPAADGTAAHGTTGDRAAAHGTTGDRAAAHGATSDGARAKGATANRGTADGARAKGTAANGAAARDMTADDTAAALPGGGIDAAEPPRMPAVTALHIDPDARKQPSSMEQHFQVGWALLRAGKAREAAVELGAAAEAGGDDPLAHDARYFQAVALVRAGDAPAAERVLARFLERAPSSLRRGRAAILLGKLLRDRGDTQGARRWFEVARGDGDPAVAEAARAHLAALR